MTTTLQQAMAEFEDLRDEVTRLRAANIALDRENVQLRTTAEMLKGENSELATERDYYYRRCETFAVQAEMVGHTVSNMLAAASGLRPTKPPPPLTDDAKLRLAKLSEEIDEGGKPNLETTPLPPNLPDPLESLQKLLAPEQEEHAARTQPNSLLPDKSEPAHQG